jgi:hypothetical protein
MIARPIGRQLAAITVSIALAVPALAGDGGMDFEALAADFRTRHGGAVELEAALAEHYATTRLGAFDVYYPADLLPQDGHPDLLKRSLIALLDLQGVWVEWLGEGDGAKAALKEIAVLRKWASSKKTFARLEPTDVGEARDLLAIYAAKPQQLASAAELARLFTSGEALGFVPVDDETARIVLAPNRLDFQQVLGFVGASDASLRGLYWHEGVRTWTEFWWNDLQVVALEYPPVGGDGDVPAGGFAMDAREKTGLEQHVAQRGAIALAWSTFGDGLTPALELGLAQALVVAAYEENNTRSGGATRGSATDGMTAFIPGGNSNGGALPPTNADSSWRADLGKDYFVKVLRAAQKAASKRAPKDKREKPAWFQLVASDTASKHDVRAPFFGLDVGGKELPPEKFLGDYLEFYRAYKTAFVHWLYTHGAGSAKASAEAFGRLAQEVVVQGGQGDLAAIVLGVYDMPLSAANATEGESLEWEFLEWLSKK